MHWSNKFTISDNLLMLICAAVTFSTSTILIAFTTWQLTHLSYFFWITDLGVELSSAVLILAGGFLCLPASWLMNLIPYHSNSLGIKGSLLCLSGISLIMLALGINSAGDLSRSVRDLKAVNSSMLQALQLIPFHQPVKKSFSEMQIELNCCGVGSPHDYHIYNIALPPSCCGLNQKLGEVCERPTFISGCLLPALNEIKNFTNGMIFLACTVVTVVLLNLFLTTQILVSNENKIPKMAPANPFHVTCVTQSSPLSFIPPPPVTPNLIK